MYLFFLNVLRDYLLLQFKDLQPLKKWPHHVVDHCDGVATEELGLLINQVLENKHINQCFIKKTKTKLRKGISIKRGLFNCFKKCTDNYSCTYIYSKGQQTTKLHVY